MEGRTWEKGRGCALGYIRRQTGFRTHSGPSLHRGTCPRWMGRPIGTHVQVPAQRLRDLGGSPNPQLCSIGRKQQFRQEISFCGHNTEGKKTNRGCRRKKWGCCFSLKLPSYNSAMATAAFQGELDRAGSHPLHSGEGAGRRQACAHQQKGRGHMGILSE